jgi:hypothetical protein
MFKRFLSWNGLPPLTLLWLALVEGPGTWGGFLLGAATMMTIDLFTREWVEDERRRGHGA